jgi:undecaprenyl-diphosphatase
MNMLHLVVLGIVQGISEFLPISSSAHLILVPKFLGTVDQGLLVDVGAHAGTLIAVFIFFWRDVLMLVRGGVDVLRFRQTPASRLVFFIIMASIPGGVLGLFLADYQETWLRDVWIIIVANVVWGAALWWADARGAQTKNMDDHMTLRTAMMIGCAQALALVPGTSRSGITMTAARAQGFSRTEAARFSFLLSIPLTAAAVCLMLWRIASGEASGESIHAFWTVAVISFLTAIVTIWGLMHFLRRFSFRVFVIYRFVLAGVLLVWFV